jgi:glutamate transport system permease protein
MSTSVLFDEPGPLTRRRHRLYTVVFAVVVAGVLAWVAYKLESADQLDPEIYRDLAQPNVWTAIGSGVVNTLKAASLAIVLAVVLGAFLAVARLSDHALGRIPATVVVQFFRAVPLLLLIVALFAYLSIKGIESEVASLTALVTGLMLYNGAVLAEVFRAGINAIPRGQSEAAYGIGLRKTQVMSIVLMPQAVRYMLPAIISQCVVVLKDTSLGFVVIYMETLREGKSIAEYVHNNLVTYLLIAVIYIAMNSVVAALATWAERRMSRSGATAAQSVAATEAVVSQG